MLWAMYRSSPKWAQQIKFVELCVTGDSVVAGLVPATSPWKDLLPTPARVPHADNADLADDSLCEISEISVSKKM